MLQKLIIKKKNKGDVKAYRVDTGRAVQPGDIYEPLAKKGLRGWCNSHHLSSELLRHKEKGSARSQLALMVSSQHTLSWSIRPKVVLLNLAWNR